MNVFSSLPRRATAVAVVVLLAAVGGGVAVAGSGDGSHDRGNAAVNQITGGSSGGGCRSGYDTQTSTLVPPDDSTSDNVPAASLIMHKVCAGAVVGQFTSEVSTSVAGDFVHVDMRATCVATGGLTDPCTVGQVVFASPGHTFFSNAQHAVQTHAMTMVWTGLKRGRWKFEVLPGGNNSANLQFRTFVVEAFNGG